MITQNFENLEVYKRFVGNVPDEMAQLLGKSRIEPVRLAIRQQTRQGVHGELYSDRLLIFVQPDRE